MKNKLLTLVLLCCLQAINTTQLKACYANFTHTYGCVGDTIWFTALDVNSVHVWDFGDTLAGNANLSYDSIAYHIYTQAGSYYVTHFNHIGAEWSYETQLITIGNTNCFDASFTVGCWSTTASHFSNTSIGSNLTYSWDFGDPASGANNTSTLQNPGWHYFSAPGTYTVTLTISDGTQTSTYSQVVTPSGNCFSSTISTPYIAPCVGDTTHIYANIPTSATLILWNFGDPASGAANLASGGSNVTHVFSSPGNYIVTLITSDGAILDTTHLYLPVIDCNVWPGDINLDGGVDGRDIFAIGLYNGMTGLARTNPTTNWVGQAAPNWTGSFPGMYLTDFLNHKHADTNGDGAINSNDIAAIVSNFGKTHASTNTLPTLPTSTSGYSAGLGVPNGIFKPNSWLEIPIMVGDASKVIPNAYGFSTIVEYDLNFITPGTLQVIYDNSWMGDANTLFHIDKLETKGNKGYIHIAMVRNNLASVINGSGEVCRLKFHTQAGVTGNLQMELSAPYTQLINNTGMFISLASEIHLDLVVGAPLSLPIFYGTAVDESQAADVKVFPTFVKDKITIEADMKIHSVSILSIEGKIIRQLTPDATAFEMNMQGVAAGTYFVEIQTEKGNTVRKIWIE